MSYPFFAYMSRLKYIARWGLMRSTIPENDAEHTLQTAMIAHALASSGKTSSMSGQIPSTAPCSPSTTMPAKSSPATFRHL